MIPSLLHWVWPHNASHNRDRSRVRFVARASSGVARAAVGLGAGERCPPRYLTSISRFAPCRCWSITGSPRYSAAHSEHASAAGFPHEARAIIAGIEIVARHGGVCVPTNQRCEGQHRGRCYKMCGFSRAKVARRSAMRAGQPRCLRIRHFTGRAPITQRCGTRCAT